MTFEVFLLNVSLLIVIGSAELSLMPYYYPSPPIQGPNFLTPPLIYQQPLNYASPPPPASVAPQQKYATTNFQIPPIIKTASSSFHHVVAQNAINGNNFQQALPPPPPPLAFTRPATENCHNQPPLRQLIAANVQQNQSITSSDGQQSQEYLPPSVRLSQPSSAVNIQKHIYIHTAPPDFEEPITQQQQLPSTLQQPLQKHYKIIFIKTPNYQHETAAAQYIQQQQQQEKTLIYVLVQKPESRVEQYAEAVAKLPINKPEVYFIKYKSNEQQQQPQLQQQQQQLQLQNQQLHLQDNDTVVVDSFAKIKTDITSNGYVYPVPK